MRWVKTAENGADYSVMNSAKQMLWLPTSREEKYKAKQAIDTFFVRTGDMAAAGFVFLATHELGLDARGFALVNIVLVLAWLAVAWQVLRENRRLTGVEEAKAPTSGRRPPPRPEAGPVHTASHPSRLSPPGRLRSRPRSARAPFGPSAARRPRARPRGRRSWWRSLRASPA